MRLEMWQKSEDENEMCKWTITTKRMFIALRSLLEAHTVARYIYSLKRRFSIPLQFASRRYDF